MLKNYLIVAFRNLKRNKAFSFINIFGLALGMVCSLLIMLWVLDEKSMDTWHANDSRLFVVYEQQTYDGKVEAGYYTPGLLYQELKKNIPEVEMATGFNPGTDNATFEAGEKIMKVKGTFTGADFFRMFSYPLLKGDRNTVLKDPSGMAISRSMANNFFGSPDSAIGKTIRFENKSVFTVAGVFEDLPNNDSRRFQYLINWEAYVKENQWLTEWGNNGPHTYIMLRADANPALVEKKIAKFLDNYNKYLDANFKIELHLQKWSDMYLHSNFKNGKIAGGRIEYTHIFSVVAIFILLIACINFMNLATARSMKRAKEIGVRKVVGAVRSSLIRQFIGEAILISFFAVLLAILFLALLLPAFNLLTNKQIEFPFRSWTFWLSLAGLVIITGFIAGSYPALFLSSFRPIAVLKGTLRLSPTSASLRKGLVVFQFMLSIILIVGTIVVSEQIKYVQTKNLGYNKENLIYIPVEGDLTTKYTLFKQQALKTPGIQLVSRTNQAPTRIENSTFGVKWDGKDPNARIAFTQVSVGYDYAKTLKLSFKEGRDFSLDFPTDSTNYLINEQALKRIGYKDPVGKPLTFWEKKGTIVGVLKDFHVNSMHAPIVPLVIRLSETDPWGSILVRTDPGKTQLALTGIEKLCKELNPKFPFTYQFADQEYQKLYSEEKTVEKLSDCFAVLAIVISCLGLLGLAMFTAEQRTREIGIRKVLGASIQSLFALLSKDFLKLVLVAFLIACPLAWWIMRGWLQNFEYRIPVSWWAFALAGVAALMIALCTISFQAIKAALANPVKSLRTE